MRLKPLHTIWLTLMTTLILLVSGVVNSAPLMSLKMMQSNAAVSSDTVANTNEHCGSHNMEMSMSLPSTSSEMDCSDGSGGMVHNCCTTACSFVFVPLPVPADQPHPLANRASISLETTDPVVQISHSLYRPPIA
ncbi:hypothetical protein [Vibrio sp. B1FLJ16]|uniref:hypothetical protein n=1 Tax=Vibrio sp. B1FLJ16 TaxID=2751178 RepID=UPI0015F3CF1C|nr:hypothetical protein [Vibrio sp. B1FLJ16]CAD7820511.1 hypothetical protein ACOMICROBIO_EPCKBFOG_03887 [Vibrio sp. B1FLJ16]CAD7821948.1 hypothetical protein ACOMICROBIO_FLGHMIGD_02916 [Vibrio sp. B1FLJ16]CAE6943317.1 hypothetical protein ACOMICROBIO_EPCKBFOG_03887 [Vibrio sp. B1FLJ16]CAE6947657.1 hypothetical protein ACOMICROBIO_FLGHMIGD_02916 [Vibrio sp. B1FLJ16]